MFSQPVKYRNRPIFLCFFVAVLLYGAINTESQTSKNLTGRVPDTSELINKATAEAFNYVSEFRNLIAREKKTIRTYDKKEKLKVERTIVSNFLVYELTNSKRNMTEFRSVLSVDGRAIADSEKRAIDLFEKVSANPLSQNELERLQKESLRFDEELRIYGLTLYQAIILSEKVRDVFSFQVSGTTRVGETGAYVVNYKQTKQSPFVRVGAIRYDVPAILDYNLDLDGLENVNERLSGTLWIDTKTFQIVRESRMLTISPANFPTPVVVAENQFEYTQSKFGIRTPRLITHTEYRVDRNSSSSKKRVEITFEYTDFTRPDVEVNAEKPKAN